MDSKGGLNSVRWFSQEDACRHALAAYSLALQACKQPEGEDFEVDGQPWATPQDFAVHFLHSLAKRLHEQGQVEGHPFDVVISGSGCVLAPG